MSGGLRQIASVVPHVFTPEEILDIKASHLPNEMSITIDHLAYSTWALCDSHEMLRLRVKTLEHDLRAARDRAASYHRMYARRCEELEDEIMVICGGTEVAS